MIQRVKIGRYEMFADDASWVGKLYVENGVNYELHIRKELERLIPRSKGFLDVGANCGIHSVSAKDIEPSVPVTAFEVSPTNVNLLCRTVLHNKFENFDVIPVALGACRKIVGVSCDTEDTRCLPPGHEEAVRWVPCRPLGSYVLQEFDVIKMDIEGFEYDAWQGMEFVWERHPTMIFEYCFPQLASRGVAFEEPLHYLLRQGYSLTILDNKPGIRRKFTDATQLTQYMQRLGLDIVDILAEA